MILDQNTIVLNPCNGFYDEYKLVSKAQAEKVNTDIPAEHIGQVTTPICILPGAVVGQLTIDPLFDVKKYPFYVTTPGMPASEAKQKFYDDLRIAKLQAGTTSTTFDTYDGKTVHIGSYVDPEDNKTKKGDYELDGGEALEAFYAKFPRQHVITAGLTDDTLTTDAKIADALDAVEILILVENALLGKGIHSLYFPGEVTPVYSPVSGDRYLGRCVPGQYTEGEPLYLCDWNPDGDQNADGYKIKGFYFCKADYDGVRSNEIKAFAGEDFICPTETNVNRKPYPFFLDVVDDSTSDYPASKNINGALTNLLRVRMA